jgi:hypothetical protein
MEETIHWPGKSFRFDQMNSYGNEGRKEDRNK